MGKDSTLKTKLLSYTLKNIQVCAVCLHENRHLLTIGLEAFILISTKLLFRPRYCFRLCNPLQKRCDLKETFSASVKCHMIIKSQNGLGCKRP